MMIHLIYSEILVNDTASSLKNLFLLQEKLSQSNCFPFFNFDLTVKIIVLQILK